MCDLCLLSLFWTLRFTVYCDLLYFFRGFGLIWFSLVTYFGVWVVFVFLVGLVLLYVFDWLFTLFALLWCWFGLTSFWFVFIVIDDFTDCGLDLTCFRWVVLGVCFVCWFWLDWMLCVIVCLVGFIDLEVDGLLFVCLVILTCLMVFWLIVRFSFFV